MKEVQKKSFPHTTMTYNLFTLQGLQPGKSHSELLRRVENEVEFGGFGTKDHFQLTYDKLIVIVAISLFPGSSQKDICSRYNTYNMSLTELRTW